MNGVVWGKLEMHPSLKQCADILILSRLWISNQQTVLLVINILSSLQQVLSNCIITALFLKQSPPLK